jgi:MYXO-CTERM domain-containing protein
MHTLTAPSGATMDCAPYTCIGTSCKTSCVSVLDCVYPASCDRNGACIAPASPTSTSTGSSGGCGVGAPPPHEDARGTGVAALVLVAASAARRRRRGPSARR